MEASLRRLLLAPDYWRERLARLDRAPRHMVILPFQEASRPGIEACELRLKAHDSTRLVALLCRSAFGQAGERVQIRPAEGIGAEHVDWSCVDRGGTDLSFCSAPDRRLEDRVLDVVRLARAACCLESVDCSRLSFGDGVTPLTDDLLIADWLRNEGWIAGQPGLEGPQ